MRVQSRFQRRVGASVRSHRGPVRGPRALVILLLLALAGGTGLRAGSAGAI